MHNHKIKGWKGKRGKNKLGKMKLAIATEEDKGMEDTVSYFFSRSKSFTIIDISDGSINNVEVVKNSAVWNKHGAGPLAIKMLIDMHVTAVAARELGIGASNLLDQNNVEKFKVKSGIPVREAVKTVLKELEVRK